MRVTLGKFACSGLEALEGDDTSAAVRKALLHYSQKLKAGRQPVDPPHFSLRDERDEPKVVFDLTVDPESEARLEQEAARQGTTLAQLAVHSVLVYLAELEFLELSLRPGFRSANRAI
jgi:hypothetical protein